MPTWNDYFNAQALHLELKSGHKVKLGRDSYGDDALIIFKGESSVELVKEEAEQLRDFLVSILPNSIQTPGGASVISDNKVRAEVISTDQTTPDEAHPNFVAHGDPAAAEKAKQDMDKLMPPTPPAAPKAEAPKVPPPPAAEPPPAPSASPVTLGDQVICEIASLVNQFNDFAVTMPVFLQYEVQERDVYEGKVDGKIALKIRDELRARWEKRQESTKKADGRTCYAKRGRNK